jgi:hypothetical protein
MPSSTQSQCVQVLRRDVNSEEINNKSSDVHNLRLEGFLLLLLRALILSFVIDDDYGRHRSLEPMHTTVFGKEIPKQRTQQYAARYNYRCISQEVKRTHVMRTMGVRTIVHM